MGIVFNPIEGIFDFVGASFQPTDYGVKYNYHIAALASYDRVSAITYLDSGLRTQRIDTVTLSSALYPDADIVKTVFYTDVGLLNQRISKIEFVGLVFSPDSLRKNFSYSLSGIKYVCDGFTYELF